MQSFTYLQTPPEVILAALKEQTPHGYKIECHETSDDFRVLAEAVNQGIDAHLEGVTGTVEFKGEYGKRGFNFTPKSMACIIRRLGESEDEASLDLRSSILTTLDIEEV
jgi:hypothetical protein